LTSFIIFLLCFLKGNFPADEMSEILIVTYI